MRLTFVVGTGRCGSTMLSAILREHPDVLSMSEFFGTLRTAMSGAAFPAGEMSGAAFPAGELDGRELWQVLARPFPMLDEMISSGLRIAELGYPLGRGRFTLAAGVPLICHYVLPMLTSDPDALYDTLAAQVPSWPRRPAAAQCEAFFGYLAGLLGRPVEVGRVAEPGWRAARAVSGRPVRSPVPRRPRLRPVDEPSSGIPAAVWRRSLCARDPSAPAARCHALADH